MQLCMGPLLHVTVVLQPSFYLSPLNGATCADEAMQDNFLRVDWGWARIKGNNGVMFTSNPSPMYGGMYSIVSETT